MSYEEKVSKTKDIISNHNKLSKKPIDYDVFINNLEESGGTTDEALKLCTWEDLEKFGLPTLLAKQVATVFRIREEPKRIITESRVAAMTVYELLENYDPRNWDNIVGKRLSDISQKKPCLVYNEDGTINVATSVKLVEEIRDGYSPRVSISVGEVPHKVYAVGERPDQFAFENPLFPGKLLRPDETCDETNRSWLGVSETTKIIVYLAVKDTKEIKINSAEDAHAILDKVSEAPESFVRRRYPNASLLYDDLRRQGKLPSLRLSRSVRPSNDPFYNTHKRF